MNRLSTEKRAQVVGCLVEGMSIRATVWTAIDADTKLIPSWLVGERTMVDACTFLADLKSRLRNARAQVQPGRLHGDRRARYRW